jgi:hypothetical protein
MQFTLRLALIALTAFAIGFPIWYRWPYEEVHLEKSPAGAVVAKRVSTWQRQWGGGRLLHGYEKSIFGDSITSTMYTRGVEHGPYEQAYKGKTTVKGQYLNGMKDGAWVHSGGAIVTVHWRRGELNGPYETEYADGRKTQILFRAGRLKGHHGTSASRLYDLLETGSIEPRIADELRADTAMEFGHCPLQVVVAYIQEQHRIPIMLDNALSKWATMLPITAEYRGIDLIAALDILTATHNLACDYRFGCIWITTPKDVAVWRDPTGVSEIKPPKDSALASAWNERTSGLLQAPLTEILATLAQRLGIEIDTAQIVPNSENPQPYAVEIPYRASFHDALGFALYKTNCRCQLDGDKLIILPPDPHESNDKPPPKPL